MPQSDQTTLTSPLVQCQYTTMPSRQEIVISYFKVEIEYYLDAPAASRDSIDISICQWTSISTLTVDKLENITGVWFN